MKKKAKPRPQRSGKILTLADIQQLAEQLLHMVAPYQVRDQQRALDWALHYHNTRNYREP